MTEAEANVKSEVPIEPPSRPFLSKIVHGYQKALLRISSREMPVKEPKGTEARRRKWEHGRGSAYTDIPPITDPNIQEIGFYGVQEPFSYIRITYNNETSDYVLSVIEPVLTEEEEDLLKLIKETFEKTLEYEWEKLSTLFSR